MAETPSHRRPRTRRPRRFSPPRSDSRRKMPRPRREVGPAAGGTGRCRGGARLWAVRGSGSPPPPARLRHPREVSARRETGERVRKLGHPAPPRPSRFPAGPVAPGPPAPSAPRAPDRDREPGGGSSPGLSTAAAGGAGRPCPVAGGSRGGGAQRRPAPSRHHPGTLALPWRRWPRELLAGDTVSPPGPAPGGCHGGALGRVTPGHAWRPSLPFPSRPPEFCLGRQPGRLRCETPAPCPAGGHPSSAPYRKDWRM
ncbi:uncharacterized protein LOC113964115 [Neopelma chrysocephalum]|uniref:uncharacterized protein LOC113964115 n=1 Tax=Neopelma chrysocephalum TaxID=114329 RepID=UPI000FCCEDB8|nr:uncharacterized protein LOC113964115 [Neopelma chrysocephalum]